MKKKLLFSSFTVVAILSVALVYLAIDQRLRQNNTTDTDDTKTAQPNSEPVKPIDIENLSWVKETKRKLALGLPGSGDSKGIIPGSIVKVGDEYKLWYTGLDDNRVYRIYTATSKNAKIWKKVNNSIPNPSNTTSYKGRKWWRKLDLSNVSS